MPEETLNIRQLMQSPKVRELFTQRSGAHQDLGIEVLEPTRERAEMRLPYNSTLTRSSENLSLHAGVVMTAIDSAMGMATMMSLEEMSSIATLELRYDELREPAKQSDVFVSAECTSIDDGIAFLVAAASDSEGEFAKSVGRFILTPATSSFFESAMAAIGNGEVNQ